VFHLIARDSLIEISESLEHFEQVLLVRADVQQERSHREPSHVGYVFACLQEAEQILHARWHRGSHHSSGHFISCQVLGPGLQHGSQWFNAFIQFLGQRYGWVCSFL
jgi:hypothetical protein